MTILQQQRLLGGAIGVAICSALSQGELKSTNLDSHTSDSSPLDEVTASEANEQYRRSFAQGFQKQMIATTIASGVSLGLIVLFLKKKARATPESIAT
jgi:hypothetical protein